MLSPPVWPRCRTGTTGGEKRIVYIFPGTECVEGGEEGENVSAPPPLSVWQCVQVKGDTKEEGRERIERKGDGGRGKIHLWIEERRANAKGRGFDEVRQGESGSWKR